MFPTVDTEDLSQVTSNTKSCLPRDVPTASDDSQTRTQTNREITLNMLIKELVLCLALALTTYAALQNTPTKISNHPQAVRFFTLDSVVTDWYRGQLSLALSSINSADISFVMYYAPWDAESQFVRGEFEKAAKIMSDRVHFSAINCWNPGSECRLQHSKIPSWPILMAYTVNAKGVLYKGPRDAHTMVNFLELVMKPVQRIASTEDLVNLLSICDAVAVGYTPLTDTSKYYNIWYSVALKSREYDPIGEICFGAVTSEDLAMDLGVNSIPNARLMLWNDTKEFMSGDSDLKLWNESSLMQWVLENFSQPVARIIPLWKKAFSFERYVDGSPILMLFTPLNPLYEQLPNYALLREVAMEYYNCKDSESTKWTAELINLQQIQRLLYQQKDFIKFCQEYKFKKSVRKQNSIFKKQVESRNNKYPWNNSTHKTQKSGVLNFLLKQGLDISKAIDGSDDNAHLLSSLGLLKECSSKVLPAQKNFYESYEQCQFYEENPNSEQEIETDNERVKTYMLPFEDDPLSPANLVQDNVKHYCKLMKFAHEWGPPVYPLRVPSVERRSNVTSVSGLACSQNASLYILAVDSVRNHHFAEALGIDITSKKDKTAVVILDSKQESQYVLSEEYSAKSVREFILNFTNKRLKRSFRTHVVDADHTHYFGSDGASEQMGITKDAVHLTELTTRTFRRLANSTSTMWVVCVCGGACGRAARAAAAGARLLAAAGLRLRVARLDALRHDLPWPYSVHAYPAIFVFPDNRAQEAESAALPASARVSAAGVVALALRTLPPPRRMRVRLALCAAHRVIMDKKICLRDLKDHVWSVIGRNLKYWRRADTTELRNAIFKRLQHLHTVSLYLSNLHVTELTDHSTKNQMLLSSLTHLSKYWHIDRSLLRTTLLNVRS